MKNKKGFTLIELLAVIVILGVIMVIAVPAITKYIDNSRKEGFTKTASGVVDAARLYYSNEYGNSSESTIEFECTTKECKSASGEKLELTKSPDKGTVKIFDDGEIIACFQRDMWYAVKNINDNEVTFGEGKCEYDEESNSYNTVPLVSREMVDELQAELDALKAKGNAAKGDILENKTAVVKGTEITGTMKNNGAWTGATTGKGNVTIPAGFHNGSGYISGDGAYDAGYNKGFEEGGNSVVSSGSILTAMSQPWANKEEYKTAVVSASFGASLFSGKATLTTNNTYMSGVYQYSYLTYTAQEKFKINIEASHNDPNKTGGNAVFYVNSKAIFSLYNNRYSGSYVLNKGDTFQFVVTSYKYLNSTVFSISTISK